MRAAANMIFLIVSDDRGHPLFADTSISNHHDPAWRCTRASWRGLFYALQV